MLLKFPDLKTVTLAISSGTIPAPVVSTAVEGGVTSDDGILVRLKESLPDDTLQTLTSWGVTGQRRAGRLKAPLQQHSCWLQLIPVQRESTPVQPDDRTQVLFELQDESLLPDIVNEILRQGNDRLSFRTVEVDGRSVVLLRVIGVPCYTLLRASEQWANDGIRAYVEQKSRLWIEVGYQHPFARQISPAPGQHLLVRGNSDWLTLDEQPFRDVYSIMDFELSEDPQPLTETSQSPRLQVPVRLTRSSTDEPANVFVLTSNAVAQLDLLVQSSSDAVLERLAFAVVGNDLAEHPTVVVRIRPGRTAPPVLVFDGLACRTVLKIPNLFVPIGRRIHPPLRRDAVRNLLAADESRLVWLDPQSESPANETSGSAVAVNETFVARSIPDSAFLPLSSWVDYVLDRDQEQLTTWRQSHQFDFEGFICPSTRSAKKKQAAKKKEPVAQPKSTAVDKSKTAGTKPAASSPAKRLIERFRRSVARAPEDPETLKLKAELADVERRFVDLSTQLDDPERLPLWNEMAELNVALGRSSDASICRQHQLWEESSAAPELLQAWFLTDAHSASRLRLTPLSQDDGDVLDANIGQILSGSTPAPAEVTQLASWIAWASRTDQGQTQIRPQLAELQTFLEKYESCLSVRTCWLAWSGLAGVTCDELTLARARDRILDRIYQQGLTPDRDVPSFLRSSGSQSGERFRQIREQVRGLRDTVQAWSASNLGASSSSTASYIDLIFAFAHARLGEASAAAELMETAQLQLPTKPDRVHRWLFEAYSCRIQAASAGQSTTGPFPDELLEQLEHIDRLDRYKIDRLRQHSEILEPLEKLDPYREWRRRDDNDIEKQLADLFVLNDRVQLAERLDELLQKKLAVDERARVLTTALELSTRLGEQYAISLIGQVVPLENKVSDPTIRARLLEKGLQIGAHYDQSDFVQDCFDRMTRLLKDQKRADIATLEALESLLSRSFVTLRRRGMRDEMALLLEVMSTVVRGKGKKKQQETERLRILLQLAGAWFYFEQDRGWKDIDAARDLLLNRKLLKEGHVGSKKQTDLAVSYIKAICQAPLNDAMDRLQDLFTQLTGIRDGQTVSSHYSLKQLDIVEALVQTVVSDSFTMDRNSQRWLDEEEFLIRRRIHRDMRAMLEVK